MLKRPDSSVSAVRCAPSAEFSSVIVASFTSKPCGSRTVPDSVAVLTCAAAELAKQSITAQSTKYMRIRILRCMSPPGFDHRRSATPSGSTARVDAAQTHGGHLWIWLLSDMRLLCVREEPYARC